MIYYQPRWVFDQALIDREGDRAVYSLTKLIGLLMRHEGMTEEQAIDWVSYNMQSTGLKDWPIIVNDHLLGAYEA